ncbi:glutathione synthase [Ascoidea rubescens DSM 1968]|uniref:Glutathione synthetase n=1 Tax=Ascoidea rubescens DSM 1968 TaxID=1344418 RepID=A0A1D2VPI6_9ASCO|nr:glutathione synthase [Ascoidea rubescens DSM 1968]ODV63532.1 glutathione synthase [Ascoidea rubescens DSM 1968]
MVSPKPFPSLSSKQQDDLVYNLHHWSLGNGLVMFPPNFKSYQPVNAPVTLFPTPFPKNSFNDALRVQPLFNEIYSNISSLKNEEWLLNIISELSNFDRDFTGRLLDCYLKAKSIGITQPLSLGLFRSDYMLNSSDNQIKQIEFNTVSVSFCGLSSKVGELHSYLNKIDAYGSPDYYTEDELPISDSINEISNGLADGNYYYNKFETPEAETVVLFIIQEKERNAFDQRHLEYSLLKNHNVKSYRLQMDQIPALTKTDPITKKIYYLPTNKEISVIYYRAGYAPSDFKSDLEWNVRTDLEVTKAIKCPTLLTQLSGCKKIQQVLTEKIVLSKFLNSNEKKEYNNDDNDDDVNRVSKTFVNIYPMDESSNGLIARKLIEKNPNNFVLKPQREGGGNNIYKENIPGFLSTLKAEEFGSYILMELINPPTYENKIIRKDEIYSESIVSELGVFGTAVWNSETDEILTNKVAGYLLRSKFSTSDEGGVAAGFGCIDSIYLY